MENINKNFVNRVLAASQRNSVVRRANRPGYRFPVRIMKHRMIRNISNAAERMQRLFSKSPSPVPPQSTQNWSDQEDDDGIIPYDEETDVFNYINVQNSAEYYSNTNTITTTTATTTADADADADAADTNNDWWFEEGEEQLGPYNEEEELNSDDDDDEINSYISFNDAVTTDDSLSFVDEINTANDQSQEQQQQQQVPAIPSPVVAYNPDLAPIADDDSFNLTENSNSNTTDQHLVAFAHDASNSQDSVSTVFTWLANLDPENLTPADIEQLLLTQTSELVFGNLASAPADADGNFLSSSLIEIDEVVPEIIHEILHDSASREEFTTDEVLYGNISREGTTDQVQHGDVSLDGITHAMLYGDGPLEEITDEVLYDDISFQEPTGEVLHGDVSREETTNEILHGHVSREVVADEMLYGDVSLGEITDEMLYGDIPLEEMIEEEHSSPESSDTSCSSPPVQHCTATVNKDEDNWTDFNTMNEYATSVSSISSLGVSLGKKRQLEDTEECPTSTKRHQTIKNF